VTLLLLFLGCCVDTAVRILAKTVEIGGKIGAFFLETAKRVLYYDMKIILSA